MLDPQTSDGRQADSQPTAKTRSGPQVVHTCGRCPARWTGDTMAHCGSCCQMFGSVHGFDEHRVGTGRYRRCLTRGELGRLGYQQNPRGVWRIPRPAESIPTSQPQQAR